MKRKTAAQLGKLAEQLPDASPAKARRLADRIVRGFYGRSIAEQMHIQMMARSVAASTAIEGEKMDQDAVRRVVVRKIDLLKTLPDLVSSIFPDHRSAARWMKTPCSGLGGRVPARLAKTKVGRAEVKSFLVGVGHGNFQ